MELKAVSFSYGEEEVIKELSLDLSSGRRVCVMGGSGRGKTTLMRLMLGLIEPSSGKVLRRPDERPSVVFQEDRLLPWYSALRNVSEVHGPRSPASPAELLEAMELSDARDKLPKELSGGMQRRCAIARALCFGGDPLLLDEPFKGLDPDMRARIAQAILRYSNGASILLITHDEKEAELLGCEEIIRL